MLKSWVINVKKSKVKRDFFTKQAKNINLDFKFFNAVTPDKLHLYNFLSNQDMQRKFFARPLLDTEIACAVSHRTLWKQLLNEDEVDYYCIFEDDTFINKDLIEIMKSQSLKNIDLIKFSGIKTPPYKSYIKFNEKYKIVKFAYGPLDAAAYRISKAGANRLLSYTYNLNYPIDVMMDRTYEHGVPIHAILPFPCKTEWHFDPNDPLYTDIGPREFKYENNRGFISKLTTRFNRLLTSLKKRISILKLLLNINNK